MLLLASFAWGEERVLDWTSLGYIVVEEWDGTYISRHIQRKEAMESAMNHAFNSGNTGTLAYRLVFPDEKVEFTIPSIASEEPPPPPPPPVDTGEQLDPNTVFACDGGEAGTTVEPTGSDSNSGLLVEGVVQPVKSLRRLEQVAEAQADGVDYRLCEGGVWHDQMLRIRKSGDVGRWNRALIDSADARTKRIKNYRALPGWVKEWEDYVVVGCYKILNGVPRPCMDAYPICEPGVATQCLDPQSLQPLPYHQG